MHLASRGRRKYGNPRQERYRRHKSGGRKKDKKRGGRDSQLIGPGPRGGQLLANETTKKGAAQAVFFCVELFKYYKF